MTERLPSTPHTPTLENGEDSYVQPDLPDIHDSEPASGGTVRTTEADVNGGETTEATSSLEGVPLPEAQDNANRHEDREILGKSVRVKLAIQEKAQQAISEGDKLVAGGRNLLSMPKFMVRDARLRLAEWRLSRKKARHEKRHSRRMERYRGREERLQEKLDAQQAADKAWTESTASSRVKAKREKKAEINHAKRTTKVENKLKAHKRRIETKQAKKQANINTFEQNEVNPHRQRYGEITNQMYGRSERAETRSAERERSVERARNEAISAKKAALERKAMKRELAAAKSVLSESLRNEENNASRREAKQILTDIFNDTSRDELRHLGRDAMARREQRELLSQVERQREQTSDQIKRTENLMKRAQGELADTAQRREKAAQTLADVQASIPAIESHVADMADKSGEGSEAYMAAKQELANAEKRMAELQEYIAALGRKAGQIHDLIPRQQLKLRALYDQLKEHSARAAVEEAAASVSNKSVDDRVRTIINPSGTEKRETETAGSRQ